MRVFTRRRQLWLIVLLTLIAFALHLADLTSRSLWLDEGFTLLRLNGSWRDLLTNTVIWNGIVTTDTNPQLYFLLVKVWMAFTGNSDFALKLVSAFAGVVFVPLTFRLTRWVFSLRAGSIAALLATISPLVAWYSQELRMYTLVICLTAIDTLAALSVYKSSSVRSWVTWVFVSALALLTHYSFIGLIVGQLVWLLIVRSRRGQRQDKPIPVSNTSSRNLSGVLLLVGVVVIVLLALATLLDVPHLLARIAAGAEYGYEFKPLQDVIGSLNSGVLFGVNRPDPSGGVISWIILTTMAAGVLWLLRQTQDRRGALLLILSAAAAIGIWFALSVLKPNYSGVRHLMVVTPVLIALAAGWIDAALTRGGAAKWLGATALCALCAINVYGLAHVFIRTPERQDDWRNMAQAIRANWRPGDVLIANAGTPLEVLQRYIGDAPIPAYSLVNLNDPHSLIPASDRVWFINTGGGDYGTPNAPQWVNVLPLQQTFDFQARTTTLRALLLAAPSAIMDTLPAEARVVDAPENLTRIVAYSIQSGNPHHPRSNMRLSLFWRRGDDAIPTGVTTLLRLQHGGQVWLEASLPSRLIQDASQWARGRILRTDFVVPMPPGLPPLTYDLEITARSAAEKEPLQTIRTTTTDDDIACCVRAPDWLHGNDIWRGSDVTLAIAEYPEAIKPGQPLPVALTWRPMQGDLQPWQTELKLEGLLGGEVMSTQRAAGTQDAPPNTWSTNELMRDQYTLPQMPYATAPGLYRLSLNRLRDGSTIDGTLLGIVRVEDYPRTAVSADIQHSVNAKVGETTLLGYTAPEPFERGKTYDVVTHWRVDAQPQRDGKLFLHVLSADGQPISQDDNAPFGGERSTLTFRPGDGVDQVHRITLPADLPAGEYVLWAGIYNSDDGARWPAQQDGRPALHDLIRLGSFTLP